MKNFILLSFVVPTLSFARTFMPNEMSSLAEERAPLIKMQLESKSAATSQVSQSKLIANPVFALQAGFLHPEGDSAGAVTDLTINQPFPWPGKRFAAINSAKILEKMADVDLAESKLLVHHSVTLLSIEQAVLTELEKHHNERKANFSTIQKFLNSRPQASPKQKIEKDMIENQIRLVEGMMYDIETRKMAITGQLEALTGEKEPKVNLNWQLVSRVPSKESFEGRLEDNMTFKRSVKMRELAKNRIEEASYLAKPDIVVGLNYRQENVAPTNHFYHANLAIVIPIIDRGQHTVEMARAHARREEANQKLVKLETLNMLNRSYQALTSAYRNTQLFPIDKMKVVERRHKDANDAFMKGRIDATTFLQSDVQIHESIDLAYYSYLKFYTTLSEVKMLTGQRLELP